MPFLQVGPISLFDQTYSFFDLFQWRMEVPKAAVHSPSVQSAINEPVRVRTIECGNAASQRSRMQAHVRVRKNWVHAR
jgi:hypothetical protein